MGDVLTLIDKAQAAYDEKQAAALEEKIRKQTFTLDDYLAQMAQLRKMGNIQQLLGMMPGVNRNAIKDAKIDEKDLVRIEAIIHSMTRRERTYPEIINASRKKRIAQGSGTTVEDVNKLLKQFDQMLKMMKQFSDMGKGKQGMRMLGRMKMPF